MIGEQTEQSQSVAGMNICWTRSVVWYPACSESELNQSLSFLDNHPHSSLPIIQPLSRILHRPAVRLPRSFTPSPAKSQNIYTRVRRGAQRTLPWRKGMRRGWRAGSNEEVQGYNGEMRGGRGGGRERVWVAMMEEDREFVRGI